jgi:threonylcarbamoyladenosine tRNA methylthiotransferase MtaB
VPPTFHIENFGCRAARADGEAIAALLRAADATEHQPNGADVVIVNTCSVTAEADREARAYIRRTHRLNPEARIIATGCYAQRAPEELADLPGVSAVIGNSHKALTPKIALHLAHASSRVEGFSPYIQSEQMGGGSEAAEKPAALKGLGFSRAVNSTKSSSALAAEGGSFGDSPVLHRFSAASPAREFRPPVVTISELLNASNQPLILADDAFAHSFLEEAPITPGAQTRPNLKIQEGCSNRCSFCVIPQTRGNSRSLSAESILSHVRNFVATGGNELVLSGINLGRWGRDLKGSGFSPHINVEGSNRALAPEVNAPRTLSALVRAILEQTSLPRLRLSSVEPMDWDTSLIALVAEYGETRLARHAHLPLQSGSDSVLRRMYRRYRPWHYSEKVEQLLRATGPALTLGADVMVGFPGETDSEFRETHDFIRSLPFGYLHLFPFSPRPGTRAWTRHAESPVPAAIVDERMTALRSLAAEKTRTHRMQFIGCELEAITLHTPPVLAAYGRTSALTDNFLPVKLSAALPANQLIRVRVTALAADNALLASPALSTTSAADSQFMPLPIPGQSLLETAF